MVWSVGRVESAVGTLQDAQMFSIPLIINQIDYLKLDCGS